LAWGRVGSRGEKGNAPGRATPEAPDFGRDRGGRIVYGKPREPRLFFDYGEMAIMRKHLKRLMAKGRVSKDGERWVLV
jgi:hypothetical protein